MHVPAISLNDEEALEQLCAHDDNIRELYRLYRRTKTPVEALQYLLIGQALMARWREENKCEDEKA